jgi:hypothetical protein
MRAVGVQAIAMLIFASSSALASDVRHSGFPESVVGMWAPESEACKDATKSTVTLSEKAYERSDASCAIDWVTETASADGPVYAACAMLQTIRVYPKGNVEFDGPAKRQRQDLHRLRFRQSQSLSAMRFGMSADIAAPGIPLGAN